MLVTELGILSEVKPSQLVNAHLPMLFNELGNEIEIKRKQLQKALSPILVTELPIFTLIKL